MKSVVTQSTGKTTNTVTTGVWNKGCFLATSTKPHIFFIDFSRYLLYTENQCFVWNSWLARLPLQRAGRWILPPSKIWCFPSVGSEFTREKGTALEAGGRLFSWGKGHLLCLYIKDSFSSPTVLSSCVQLSTLGVILLPTSILVIKSYQFLSKTCLKFPTFPLCLHNQSHLEPHLVSWVVARVLPNPPCILQSSLSQKQILMSAPCLHDLKMKHHGLQDKTCLCLHVHPDLLHEFTIPTISCNYIEYFQIPLWHHCLCHFFKLWCFSTGTWAWAWVLDSQSTVCSMTANFWRRPQYCQMEVVSPSSGLIVVCFHGYNQFILPYISIFIP